MKTRDKKSEALRALRHMAMPQETRSELRNRILVSTGAQAPGILEEAEIIESEFRADLRHRYADTLKDARAAFLEDSFYAVKIAEDSSAMLAREENQDDPQAATELVLKLHSEGASVAEIMRIARMTSQSVRDILAEAGNAPEKPEKAPRKRVDPRELFPEPRPVYVRYVEPRTPLPPESDCKIREMKHSGYVCPPDHKHEVRSTCYTRHGCRCEPCREWASRRYHKRRQGNLKI